MTVDETPALSTFRTFMLRWVTVLLILPEEIICSSGEQEQPVVFCQKVVIKKFGKSTGTHPR